MQIVQIFLSNVKYIFEKSYTMLFITQGLVKGHNAYHFIVP